MRRILGAIIVILFLWASLTVFMSTMPDDKLVHDMKDAFSNTNGLIAVTDTVQNGNLSTPYTDNVVYYELVHQSWECYDDDCSWSTVYTSSDYQNVDVGYTVVDPLFDVHSYTVRDDTGTKRVLEYTIVQGDQVTVWGQYAGDRIIAHDVFIVSDNYVQTLEKRVTKIVWTQNIAGILLFIMWLLLLAVNYRRQYSWHAK